MTTGTTTRRGPLVSLLLLLALQTVCAAFFALDAAIDVLHLDAPGSLEAYHRFEYVVAFALLVGVFMTAREIRTLLRRNARLNDQIRAASGEFADLIEEHFDAWGLTPAERDVAILSIKGLSVAEIAEIRESKDGTIKAHSAAVYRKAGVSGRMQLLSLFLDELIAEPVAAARKPVAN